MATRKFTARSAYAAFAFHRLTALYAETQRLLDLSEPAERDSLAARLSETRACLDRLALVAA